MMEEFLVYLLPKITVLPNYFIHTPLTTLIFSMNASIQRINMDKSSQNPNSCSVNLVSNEQTKRLLTDLYAKMRILNSEKLLNDIVVSSYIHCSFSIDKLSDINGNSLQVGSLTELINKKVQANIQIYAIHSVTRQNITTTFPIFVLHDLSIILDP